MPKPFFRAQTQSWYVEIKRKQTNLGRDKDEAFRLYHELMAGRDTDGDGGDPQITVQTLIGRHLEWLKLNRSPGTREFYRVHLRSFGEFVGDRLRVRDLKRHHLAAWIAEHYTVSKPQPGRQPRPVSDNYRHNAVRAVKRCLKWAIEEDYILRSPVMAMKNYPSTRRETYVSAEEFDKAIALIEDVDFREFVMLLRLTGCRPKEGRDAERRHFVETSGCLDFPRTEAKGKQDRRVIILDGEALRMVQRRAATYPKGPLFRNSQRRKWTKSAVVQRFSALSEKTGLKVTAYTLRHAWATDALARGVPLALVAAIMGHRGTRILTDVYSHLDKHQDGLRAALRQANGGSPA